MDKRLIGVLGEKLVCKWYTDQKYKLLSVNYKTRLGEIDIIAQYKNTVVFSWNDGTGFCRYLASLLSLPGEENQRTGTFCPCRSNRSAGSVRKPHPKRTFRRLWLHLSDNVPAGRR